MDQEINKQRMQYISEMILEVASGNFAYRIPRTKIDDKIEGLVIILNWMAEDFNQSVFHNLYINPHQTYKHIIQCNFIVDDKLIIKNHCFSIAPLLGYTSNELRGFNLRKFLVKKSVALIDAILPEMVQNNSFSTTISLEFDSVKKLTVPAYCSISRLLISGDFMISFAYINIDIVKEETLKRKNKLPADKQGISNYLDLKSTQAVYDYLLANDCSTIPTIKILSRIFGTNEFKLKNGFKHYFKTTIHKFHNEKRLSRAQFLIGYTQIPLKTIAIMTGFPTYASFSKAFKIKFSDSPSDIERKAPSA